MVFTCVILKISMDSVLSGGKPSGEFGKFHLEHIVGYYQFTTHSRVIDTIIFQRFYSFFLSGFMSDNETVKFVFRMALHNHSRIGNNVKLVLYKVGLSVNQIRDISPADMSIYKGRMVLHV